MSLAPSLLVTASPHLRSSASTSRIMLDVIIALLPATALGVYFFGFYSLALIAVTVLGAMAGEWLTRVVLLKRDNTLADGSAVLTGLLLALNLPPTLPLWMALLGGLIATALIKQLFGGLGQNFMNPALGARVMLLLAWTGPMTKWAVPQGLPDAVAGPTPLAILKGKEAAGAVLPSYWDMTWGSIGGCIGETSVLAIALGALYLLVRRVISPTVPFIFIGTVALGTWIFAGHGALFTGDGLAHILTGGLFLGAFFMATDYATSPVSFKGKVIFALGCGLLTVVIRLWTNYPEGVSFAIILMNIITPLIDRWTVPKSLGGAK